MRSLPEVAERGSERIEFVQALRGIAALAVVLYHARIWINGPAFLDLGNRLFENGAAGVDLFFVISGFIMVHTTWDLPGGPRSAVRFFAKRFVRIWPVYVIATLVFLVAKDPLWTLTAHVTLVRLSMAFAFLPYKLHGAPFFGYTPNEVGWSLNYEVWFYLLFAIALVAGSRRWRWAILVGLFALFLVIVPFLYTGHVTADAYDNYAMSPGILNLAANSMVWEFLAGAAIGVLYRSSLRVRSRTLLGTFVALSVTAVLWQQLSQEWRGQGMTGWGPALIVMMLALAMWNKEYPIKVSPRLLWLGDVSFSLYLVHRIPQVLFPRVMLPEHATLTTGAGFVLAVTVTALVLAQLSHRYIEQGIAERLRRWLLRRIG